MNEFTKLRERAREKRDKLIADAKKEYEATLLLIANLEQDLLGRESSRHQKVSACIERLIPRDRTFTTVDIVTGLEALDPGRVWRKRSVDNHLSRLREKGIIKRVRQVKNGMPAVYARADLAIKPSTPFDNLTMEEVMLRLLVRPMTAAELTVAMLEAGYETAMGRKYLRNAVERRMKESEGKFRREGQKWVVG